jgi:hypothetical protein
MSAGQHHAAAETLEKESREHAQRSDPGSDGYSRCAAWGGYRESSVCWSIPSSQADHQREAKWLHELSERHRSAGHTLVDAEFKACTGLSKADRDVSPFFHRDDVASVARLSDAGAGSRTGATITFRPVEGLTIAWLESATRCHLARSAALGHGAELGYCPLAVRGANAKVSQSEQGPRVTVWADDQSAGQEILRRAQKLVAR